MAIDKGITNERNKFNRTLLICSYSACCSNGNRKEVTMSEITKLYENAEIGKRMMCFFECPRATCNVYCEHFEKLDMSYPIFTAEKQLKLLKFCFDKYEKLEKVRGLKERCIIYYRFDKNGYTEFINCETWEETIAGLINNLWQDLTEEEKQQVKGILE